MPSQLAAENQQATPRDGRLDLRQLRYHRPIAAVGTAPGDATPGIMGVAHN